MTEACPRTWYKATFCDPHGHIHPDEVSLFITGRSRLVGGITLDHLRRDVWQDIPAQNLHVQRIYTGVGALLQHKAMTLERIKAWCYVGDQDVDARAASMAGATFLPAHTFHGPDRVVQP